MQFPTIAWLQIFCLRWKLFSIQTDRLVIALTQGWVTHEIIPSCQHTVDILSQLTAIRGCFYPLKKTFVHAQQRINPFPGEMALIACHLSLVARLEHDHNLMTMFLSFLIMSKLLRIIDKQIIHYILSTSLNLRNHFTCYVFCGSFTNCICSFWYFQAFIGYTGDLHEDEDLSSNHSNIFVMIREGEEPSIGIQKPSRWVADNTPVVMQNRHWSQTDSIYHPKNSSVDSGEEILAGSAEFSDKICVT